MARTASVASSKLQDRRQALQNRRRAKYWQSLWRLLILGGLAGGLGWVIMLPDWVIHQSSQIEVSGNQYLSDDEIRRLIPLAYPQSILQLKTQTLVQTLKTTAPIEEVKLTRKALIHPSHNSPLLSFLRTALC